MQGDRRDPVDVQAPLVGRDVEVATLRARLTDTLHGCGGCIVVSGPAGIGKTRLLDEAAALAGRLGLAVGYGRATEIDRVAPATTLRSALRQIVDSPPADVDELGELLEAYANRTPLLLVIDDAQWTDEFSALALRRLVNELSGSAVRWLLSRRPTRLATDAQRALDRLVQDGAEHLRLGPLDDEAVGRLCRNTLRAEPDVTVLTLADRGQGNPFLLEQLLTTLASTDQILVDDGTATVVGDDLPASFHGAVEQRLRGLTEDGRRLLEAGSIFGRPFSIHAAAGLLGVAPVALTAPAAEALAAGVLVERDARLAFAHDLLRQAIYHNLPASVQAALHREAAAVLRAEGVSVVEIAEHLARGGRTGDRAAVVELRRAAAEVADRAPGTAADFVLHALELVGERDEVRAALSAEAVKLLTSAGRMPEAQRLGAAALGAGLDPATEATLLLGLAEASKYAGQNRQAVLYAERALQRTGVPEAVRAELYAVAAHGLLYIDRLVDADDAGKTADELGTGCAKFAASVFGKAARSVVAQSQGRLLDALTHAGDAVAVADRQRGEAVHRHPRIWYGAALAALDRFDEAGTAYATGRREADRLGTAWSQPLWHLCNASLLAERGWLDAAVAEAEAGLRVTEQLDALQLSVPLLGLLARIAVRRNALPLAKEHLRRVQRLLARGITATPEDVAWPAAYVQQADGQPQVAVRTLGPLYDALPERLLLLSNEPAAGPALVRIALAAGERDLAKHAAAAARVLCRRNPGVPSLAGAAAHAEGLLHGDPAALHAAIEHYRGAPRPLARAGALEDAAVLEAARGERDRALRLLRAARDECAACDARRDLLRLDGRLGRLGGRAGHPHPSAGCLTSAEEPVARLAAAGRTNRQIAAELQLSRHTVDSHLRHIFTKLGVNNRTALAHLVRIT